MNPFEIAALTAAIFNFVISAVVVRSSPRSPLTLPYLLWGISVTVWNVGAFHAFGGANGGTELSMGEAVFWLKVLQAGVIMMPVSLMHVCLVITEIKPGRWLWAVYALHAGFVLSLFTDLFVRGGKQFSFGWWTTPGPAFWVFLGSYLIMTSSLMGVLCRRQKDLWGMPRTRVRSLLAALVALWIFGTNDLLPILNLLRIPDPTAKPLLAYYLGTPFQFLPLGSLAAIFYAVIIAYSVLQHQLLDVHIALGRVGAHLTRFAFIFAIGLALQLIVYVIFRQNLPTGAKQPSAAQLVNLLTAISIASLVVLMLSTLLGAFLFPRLMGDRAEDLERALRGDRFEFQDRVREFAKRMSRYQDLETMLDDLNDLLTRTFHLRSYCILLREQGTNVLALARSYPEELSHALPELKSQTPLFKFFNGAQGEYLALNPAYVRPGARLLEKQAREQLAGSDAQFCFPLASQREPFGLLLVGAKSHGQPFSANDISLLVSLMKNMSVAVHQIRLQAQISQNEESDLLGRMSRGMAHDLNNLLTPIWTLLQLSTESGPEPKLDEELLPTAVRNLRAMRAYIKEALFFSENLRPDFQVGRLDLLIAQAVQIARASRKKSVDVIAATPGEVLCEMDEVLIQRLLANIVSNAIDASQPGSEIRVELAGLAKGEADEEWLRIRVIDHGEGIPKEDLNRVFTAYFTTKDRGDEQRGAGLGLAISRKITNLHGGNLTISSQLKIGTTVQIDLPSQRPKSHPKNLPSPV